MTEQELIELWGDGTQFGMNTEMVGALNNAFREVAVKFALVVADKAYGIGYDIGAGDEYDDGKLNLVDYFNQHYPNNTEGVIATACGMIMEQVMSMMGDILMV